MIQWPTSLPQMPSRKYICSPTSGLLPPDGEQSQSRNRAYPEYEATISFEQCTMAHYSILRSFYDITLNHSAWFQAPWLSVMGFSHHICKMSGSPSVKVSGNNINISVKLIIMAVTPTDELGNIIYGEAY